MEHIRLPLIHPAAFCEEIEMDELMMTSMKIVPIMAEARKYHIMGVAGESKRFKPRIKASRTETLVSVGGTDRVGGYNSSYVEVWNPQNREWRQMAKLPQNFVTFANTEYSVCSIKNQIIVTGGRNKQNDVWIYQVLWPKSRNSMTLNLLRIMVLEWHFEIDLPPWLKRAKIKHKNGFFSIMFRVRSIKLHNFESRHMWLAWVNWNDALCKTDWS